MENLAIEIKFAQNLASNETKTRLKALKKLKKYLRAKSASKKDGFSSEDLLKLWKGLHFCMWMQDKPLLQEELSTSLTQLVHDLSTVDAQMIFIKVFFITEAREWNSIDIWRLDKFMMMVRNMLFESFMVVKKLKWESKLLDQLMEILSETVMNPDSDSIPDGLKIHFSDIYLEEVEKIGEGHLTGAQLLKLLVPFVRFMQKAKNMTLLKRVKSQVFEPVITRLADEVKLKKAEISTSDESKEQDEVPFRSLKFDGKLISDHLFQVGQEDCVLSRNRPVMYELVKKIKDIQEGVLPEKREIVVSEGVTHKDIQTAVNELIKFDGNKNRKKKLKKKKNKQAKQNGVNENADPNNNRSTDQVPEVSQGPSIPQIGEKRKHSFIEDDTDMPMTKIKKKKQEAENTGTEKKTLKKLMNKFSKLDVKKGKKDKKPELIQNEKTASPQSKAKLKSIDCDQSVTHSDSKMEVNVEEATNNLDTEKAQVFTVHAEVPTSLKKNTESKTTDLLKTKGKRTYSQTESSERSPSHLATLSVSSLGEKRVPDIVVESPSPVGASVSNTSDLQDGEIEIWIPNKKYKGNKTTTPQSNFAVFDHSKPPAAFVKRSLSKSLKKTPSALKTQGSGRTPGSNKRVSFDMKKNKAQAFKESLDSPLTPFNPSKKPESGILKSPAPEGMQATSSKGQGSATRSVGHKTMSQQTPVTRQSVKQVAGKKVSHVVTPVVSIGFEKKKATPAKRHRAADFFL